MSSENLLLSASSAKAYLMSELHEHKEEDVSDKKKEAGDDFSFSEKENTEISEGNCFHGMNEPIVYSSTICRHNFDEFTNSNSISAAWISSGQPKNVSSNHGLRADRLSITLYKLFIFILLIIATLIVFGKI